MDLASLSTATTDRADLAVLTMGKSFGSDYPVPAPEPSTLVFVLLGLACGILRFATKLPNN
jgi:hypothetical protein